MKRALTDKEIAYRNRGRGRPRKVKLYTPTPIRLPYGTGVLDKEIYYLGNCMFWLKEFQEGRSDKPRVLETATAIEKLAADIKMKIKF